MRHKYGFVRPSVARAAAAQLDRRARRELAADLSAAEQAAQAAQAQASAAERRAADATAQMAVYLDRLKAVQAATSAVAKPNGTTQKIARIVADVVPA